MSGKNPRYHCLGNPNPEPNTWKKERGDNKVVGEQEIGRMT